MHRRLVSHQAASPNMCTNVLWKFSSLLFICEWKPDLMGWAPYQRVSATKPWLIVAHLTGLVSRDPCNCTLPRFARQLLIQYSHVHACLVRPDCMSGMCEYDHLRFYSMLSDQSRGAGGSRSQDGVLRAAALSGHVWTIQHGCHQSIPGVCSCWVMASHWSPKTCSPGEPAGSGLHIPQVVLVELHVWYQVSRVRIFLYTDMLCFKFHKKVVKHYSSQSFIVFNNSNWFILLESLISHLYN